MDKAYINEIECDGELSITKSGLTREKIEGRVSFDNSEAGLFVGDNAVYKGPINHNGVQRYGTVEVELFSMVQGMQDGQAVFSIRAFKMPEFTE